MTESKPRLLTYPRNVFLMVRLEFIQICEDDLEAKLLRVIEKHIEAGEAVDGWVSISYTTFIDELFKTVTSANTIKRGLKGLAEKKLIFIRYDPQKRYDSVAYKLHIPVLQMLLDVLTYPGYQSLIPSIIDTLKTLPYQELTPSACQSLIPSSTSRVSNFDTTSKKDYGKKKSKKDSCVDDASAYPHVAPSQESESPDAGLPRMDSDAVSVDNGTTPVSHISRVADMSLHVASGTTETERIEHEPDRLSPVHRHRGAGDDLLRTEESIRETAQPQAVTPSQWLSESELDDTESQLSTPENTFSTNGVDNQPRRQFRDPRMLAIGEKGRTDELLAPAVERHGSHGLPVPDGNARAAGTLHGALPGSEQASAGQDEHVDILSSSGSAVPASPSGLPDALAGRSPLTQDASPESDGPPVVGRVSNPMTFTPQDNTVGSPPAEQKMPTNPALPVVKAHRTPRTRKSAEQVAAEAAKKAEEQGRIDAVYGVLDEFMHEVMGDAEECFARSKRGSAAILELITGHRVTRDKLLKVCWNMWDEESVNRDTRQKEFFWRKGGHMSVWAICNQYPTRIMSILSEERRAAAKQAAPLVTSSVVMPENFEPVMVSMPESSRRNGRIARA